MLYSYLQLVSIMICFIFPKLILIIINKMGELKVSIRWALHDIANTPYPVTQKENIDCFSPWTPVSENRPDKEGCWLLHEPQVMGRLQDHHELDQIPAAILPSLICKWLHKASHFVMPIYCPWLELKFTGPIISVI